MCVRARVLMCARPLFLSTALPSLYFAVYILPDSFQVQCISFAVYIVPDSFSLQCLSCLIHSLYFAVYIVPDSFQVCLDLSAHHAVRSPGIRVCVRVCSPLTRHLCASACVCVCVRGSMHALDDLTHTHTHTHKHTRAHTHTAFCSISTPALQNLHPQGG